MKQNFESKILIIFLISIFVGVGFVFYLQNKAYAATCGNGVCEPGENCSNCSIDCGSCPTCGNGVCEPGENCSNCSIDCGPCGPTCGNGVCESGENPSNCCIDCYQKHYQKGCYDNDVYWYDCFGQRNDKAQECGDSDWANEYRCSGNWVQRKWVERGCSNDQCFENYQWKNYRDCQAEGKVCQNGNCVAILPSIDLKANGSDGPVIVHYQDFVSLSWTSQNAVSCQASGDWSGSKPTSGAESIQLNSVKTYTFTLTCYSSSGQSASDSVRVIVLPKPPKVITKPVISTK